jgi:hypothetical protein
MAKDFYIIQIDNMPFGLKRFVARVIERSRGHDRGTPLEKIIELAERQNVFEKTDERLIRELIEELRNEEWDIANNMDGFGYYLPLVSEKPLYLKFLNSYTSRARHIFGTARAMNKTASLKFGGLQENPQQPDLF